MSMVYSVSAASSRSTAFVVYKGHAQWLVAQWELDPRVQLVDLVTLLHSSPRVSA